MMTPSIPRTVAAGRLFASGRGLNLKPTARAFTRNFQALLRGRPLGVGAAAGALQSQFGRSLRRQVAGSGPPGLRYLAPQRPLLGGGRISSAMARNISGSRMQRKI